MGVRAPFAVCVGAKSFAIAKLLLWFAPRNPSDPHPHAFNSKIMNTVLSGSINFY